MEGTGVCYLVQLIEISKDDDIVRQVWENLFPHFPSSHLFLFPVQLFAVCVGCALTMVAAKKRITAIDDILAIDPIVLVLFSSGFLFHQLVMQIDVSSPRAKRIRRDCRLVC